MSRFHDSIRAAARSAVGIAGPTLAAVTLAVLLAFPTSAAAQDAVEAQGAGPIVSSTVLLSGDLARLELSLASGETQTIELNAGEVIVNGQARASYEAGGAFEHAWRELLRDPALGEPATLDDFLAGWSPGGEPGNGEARAAVLAAFDRYGAGAADAGEAAGAAGAAADAGAAVDAAGEAGAQADAAQERMAAPSGATSIGDISDRLASLDATLDRIAGGAFEPDGEFALVVRDDHHIPAGMTIEGDVALVGGRLIVDGAVDGNVFVLGGELELEPGARVQGDVRSLGGEVEIADATVTGEILSLSALGRAGRMDAADAPYGADADRMSDSEWRRDRDRDRDQNWRGDRGFFRSAAHNVGHAFGGVFATIAWLVGLGLFGSLLIYFMPERLESVATEARADMLRSFGVGLAGQLLFWPIMLVLCVLIVTWLVIPFFLLAVAIAIPAGYLAVARVIGEGVVDRRFDLFDRFNLNRENTYYYVFNGLVVLLAPFALAAVLHVLGDWLGFIRGLVTFIVVVLTWAAATTGFGAIILTRGGGLVSDFRGFRRKRAVPLDEVLKPETKSDRPGPDVRTDNLDDDEVDDV